MNAQNSHLRFLFFKLKNLLKKSSDDFRLTIGEILRQREIITQKQLETALEVQKEKLGKFGKAVRLGQIIVELGYASESDLVRAINDDYKISATSLNDDIKAMVNAKRGTFIEGLPPVRVPIWVKLFLTTILLISVTIAILSGVILNQQRDRLYDQTLKIGMVSLKYFVSNSRIDLLKDNIIGLNSLIKEATAVEGLLYASIVDGKRIIKAHTDLDRIDKAFEGFGYQGEKQKSGGVTYFDYTLPTGQHILNLTEPVVFKGKSLGEVHVGLSIDFMERMIKKERLAILMVAFVIILLSAMMAVFMGFRFSRPISNLVLATQEIGKGNYDHKVILARNDELGNLASAFNKMGDELWKNLQMQRSFGKYVGSEVLDMIMANPETTWLKGRRNEASILFSDIRGFTAYSEEREPEVIVENLNAYFEIATQAILNHGGYIDKFIGDAVLAVFGVPVYHEDHVLRAVSAALEMQSALKKSSHMKSGLLHAVGVSINSGIVVSGNIGSQVKMEYTVIGDSVNLASRLNSLAGPGEIIASSSIHEKLENIIQAEPLSPVKIKGKSEPVQSYRIHGMKGTGYS